MRLKIILAWALLCCLGACSFKSEDQFRQRLVPNGTSSDLKIDPNEDSDGDGIFNKDEVSRGTDPFVADVPVLETRFIQNFKIDVNYNHVNDNKVQSFVIQSKIKDTDSSFKYRVGKMFGVEKALNLSAKEGRFSGHSYGEIRNEDFSWVKYPSLDPLAFHSDVIKFRPVFDREKIENVSINLVFDSSVKLVGTRFKEIKDLSLSFYYHDFEKDSYVLLKNVLINRIFQRGVNETFTVVIENVPLSFLKETYLKHGEFLVSEVENYFIPELDRDYKTLIAGVRAKTIPVMLSTPTEEKVFYVTVGKGISFIEVLSRIFSENFAVENNALKRVGQYENNLGTHEHLIDIKDKDKRGNWFVLTNKFKEHFLDHLYTPEDHITLAYITGNVLASQPNSEQTFYGASVLSVPNNETVALLGKISPNSKVEIAIKGLNRFGHEPISTVFNENRTVGGGCHNCSSVSYSCKWIGNKLSAFSRNFDLNINFNEEWSNIFLVINEEKFKLSQLITEKKAIVRNLDFSFLITIEDVSKIKPLKESENNHLSLALYSTQSKTHQGIKLISQEGSSDLNWCSGGVGAGSLSTVALANSEYGGEISTGSLDFQVLLAMIENCRRYPTNTGAASYLFLKLKDDLDYDQNFSLAINSKITNYYN